MEDDIQYDEIPGGLPAGFEFHALRMFRFQYRQNELYRRFVQSMHILPETVNTLAQIPFLPISFFKTHSVRTGDFEPEIVFSSSGTTGMQTSAHAVRDLGIYRESFVRGFEHFYGAIDGYCIIGLLPSYLERTGSSLVLMVEELISLSAHPQSGFYLDDFEKLASVLSGLERAAQPTLLIGVTFALLDFAAAYPMSLVHTIVMETGGMKGRKKEITREELHQSLSAAFGIEHIQAEYGMTELLSQAYSVKDGLFNTVPWMKALLRDEDDPLRVKATGEGLLNIIDLANMHSCAFIATDDIGRIHENGSFEILGRMDNSDVRGCSLLLG